MSLKHLIPSLLYLYVDIEFTGGANQFYEKFNVRYQIGELCEYLWSVSDARSTLRGDRTRARRSRVLHAISQHAHQRRHLFAR